MLYTIPWWVYLAICGILFSAIMTVRASKKETELEEDFIESEGMVYMERLKMEQEKRRSNVNKNEPM